MRRLPGPLSLGLAQGAYSDYALLCANPPQLEGRVILTDQGMPPVVAEDSLLVRCGRNQHKEQPWPVFWIRRRQARLISPSLALVDEQKRVSLDAVYGPTRLENSPSYRFHTAFHRPVLLPGKWTSIVSRWMSTDRPQAYGHWLRDALPRLALLGELPPDVGILVPPHRMPYQVESLKMLGLLDRCRWTSERHLVVEDYYFSSPTSMICCWNPYAVNWLRSTFIPLAAGAKPGPKRFFLRRTGRERNMVHEERVYEFFRGIGWAVIDASKLGFAEQVRLFSEAEAVCAIHGSGLANVIWCQPGCKVLELFCERFLAGDSEWVTQCIPAEHRHLIFPSDNRDNARVDLAMLRESLKSYGVL